MITAKEVLKEYGINVETAMRQFAKMHVDNVLKKVYEYHLEQDYKKALNKISKESNNSII